MCLHIRILVYFYTLCFAADRIAHCVDLLLVVQKTSLQFLVKANG